ncbi:hypothetical protein FRACA_60032 [Frankia canadensis]|uniref:Uncharacterized protein n=1 Tax=Frankia canadensis TaxID=1836972 RepID=A0A2I2KZF5_9ACTN|nr:hypothetical protein FRACA_60032 [Frankia canadensis]SOU58336.1 hypothetical protein FRACA_60032 [Frankia canadensis]
MGTQRDRARYATFCKFFDQAYYPCLEAAIGRPYALYVHGNSDTTGAIRSVETITTGLRWKRLREPLSAIGEVARRCTRGLLGARRHSFGQPDARLTRARRYGTQRDRATYATLLMFCG